MKRRSPAPGIVGRACRRALLLALESGAADDLDARTLGASVIEQLKQLGLQVVEATDTTLELLQLTERSH